ncbi:MAG: hypothetical protein M0037_14640 [Betaproteobacteria bacterium]|nr:hypothetical protein [Betaproteobacteria bacterium]
MSSKQIILYCVVCLGVTLAALTVMFRYAAVSPRAMARAHIPQPMESFPPLTLGGAYGTVSMVDLVGYYLQHPPAAAASGVPAAAPVRIGGC